MSVISRRRTIAAALLAGLGAALLVGAGSGTSSPASQPCASGWVVADTGDLPTVRNVLNGVAASPSGAVWAVGSHSIGADVSTVAQSLDGTRWTIQPDTASSSGFHEFQAVAAVTPASVWAVGVRSAGRTLIERWDGEGWQAVPSPNSGMGFNELLGVDGISASDAWAVGRFTADRVQHPLAVHWDGAAWRMVSPQAVGPYNSVLRDVDALSPADAWAVGWWVSASGAYRPLIERWSGTSWSAVGSPNPGPGDAYLTGVAAVGANDVWAVGTKSEGGTRRTLVLHWNGEGWRLVPSPNGGPGTNILNAAFARLASDVWAVGSAVDAAGVQRTLIFRWDGTEWRMVPSPNAGLNLNALLSVTGAPGGLWAVGYYLDASGSYRSLVLRLC